MRRTTTKKKLIFEGAGWDCADNNDVGNCRIRTTFLNRKGEIIYLEMGGHASSKYSIDNDKLYNLSCHISHLHKIKDGKTHNTKKYYKYSRITMEYTKENILKFVNTNLDCDFDSIIVNNKDWNGFSITGEEEVEGSREVKLKKPSKKIKLRKR